jgi:hypothetical protein
MDGGERRERGKAFWLLREPQISHDCAGAVHQQLEPVIQVHPFLPSVALGGHDVSITPPQSGEEGKRRERAGTLSHFRGAAECK